MSLDIAIFIGFLVVNLFVGLSYGRGIKTIKDYALGGRNFSTPTLVTTIVATWISGSGFFNILSKTYSGGLYYVLASIGMTISFLTTALIFVPKMKEFLGSTSVAESMGVIYGKEVRFITAITGLIGSAGIIAVQFKAFGNIFNYFLDVPGTWAVVLAGSIVIIYSTFGGMRAVTFTDVLQFFTFGFAIPLVGFLVWYQAYNLDINISILKTLHEPKFNIKHVLNFGNPEFIATIPLFFYYALPALEPVIFQRISTGKNIEQIKKAFSISSIIILIVILSIAWIPLLIYTINPDLEAGQLLSYIIDNYTYTGLKGIMMIGVAAMAMSTADAFINSSSVLFANDIYRFLKINNNKELLVSKIFSFSTGVFAIVLALTNSDLLQIALTANAFYLPLVMVPLMLTILGFRSSTKSVLTGMGAAFVTVVGWKIIGFKADCIVFAMAINLIFLIGTHYILKQPGGWVKAKKDDVSFIIASPVDSGIHSSTLNKKMTKFSRKLANFNVLEFFKKHSPKNELTYMSFGVYCIFYTLTTMYSTQDILFNSNSKVILYIYQIMLCTSVCMAMYPIWPPKIKYEIIVQVAWNFVLFYMLVFFSGFFVLISNFYPLQFVVFTINIIVVALLSSWRTALIMILPGFWASTLFYKYYAGITDVLDVSLGSAQYIMMYSLLLLGATFVVFLRPREYAMAVAEERAEHLASTMNYKDQEVEKALTLKNEFIRNVTHEYHAPMTGVISTLDSLIAAYDVLDDYGRKKAIETIYNSAIRLESFDGNIRDLARLSSGEAELSIAQVNLSDLVKQRLDACTKIYLEKNRQVDYSFVTHIEDDAVAEVDEYYLTQTLDNLIVNAFTYCTKGTIKLELKKKNINIVEFSITDEGIGIPKDELQDIFGEFTVSSKTRTPAGGRGVGLALCKRVLEMHKGEIKANSKDGETTFTFFLPLVFDNLTKSLSEEVIEIARNLLKNGIDIKVIAKATGLRESQIKALQHK